MFCRVRRSVSSCSLPLEYISAQLLRAALADSSVLPCSKIRLAAVPGRMFSSCLFNGLQLFFYVDVHYVAVVDEWRVLPWNTSSFGAENFHPGRIVLCLVLLSSRSCVARGCAGMFRWSAS
ncbi:hypothetical protein MRB53_016077 [Persea americana]|uniref:Uncharacterized protein n=1 Tax=Persea americana TaxID=3435 RepID=A0ACC2M161_PERAE|nr:hypothetical protein MRB53_016077 [Persea americana]